MYQVLGYPSHFVTVPLKEEPKPHESLTVKSYIGENEIPLPSMTTITKQVLAGDTLMEAKTIYNFRNKSKQQIQDILMHVQDEFLAAHPEYQYDNWKYKDGKYGERTIYLIFNRK